MKIRWKIDLAISGAFLVGLALAGVGAYTILTRNALEDSLQNARIMIEEAWAVRAYTANSIKPLLEPQMKVQFPAPIDLGLCGSDHFQHGAQKAAGLYLPRADVEPDQCQ